MDEPLIYTVGHSTHPIDDFLDLIKAFSINCVVDVRTVAASVYNPQYNQSVFSPFLKANGVAYLHFPEEFGARHSNPEFLDEEGKVDFELVRKSDSFKHGVERLQRGLKNGYVIALMCSESDPFECHRFSMVAVGLGQAGMRVDHILKNKTVATTSDLEQQLLKKYSKKIPRPDIFQPDVSREEQLTVAYRLRNKDIAYSPYTKQSLAENDD
jgi:uncharacterized protein (DUF488 family)